GLIFAAAYLQQSLQLPLGRLSQPGAAVFPLIVGTIMALASLLTVWEGWRLARHEMVEWPIGEDRRRLLWLIAIMVGYVATLPWAGQVIGSILFCMLLMRILSRLSWLRIAAYSLVLSGALYWVFIILLKVPMPRGVLGF